MDLRLVMFITMGGVAGAGMRLLTLRLIRNRSSQPIQNSVLSSRWSPFAWVCAGALICGTIALLISDIVQSIEYMGIFFALISIAAVDNSIRKIPNELILILLLLKLGAVAFTLNPASLIPAFIGLIAGFVLFLVPSYLGMGIGWGDVKLAAAAGFCLGLIGILEAAFVMAIVLGMYLLYLTITKKGNRKTKVAIGPSLSLGIGLSILFPLAMTI